MSQAYQHKFVHEVDHFGPGHEFLFKRSYSYWERCRIHQKCAFRAQMVNNLLHILFEVTLKKPVGLIQNKKFTLIKQVIVSFDQIFQSTWGTDNKMDISLLDLSIIFLDHGAANEELDIDLGKF